MRPPPSSGHRPPPPGRSRLPEPSRGAPSGLGAAPARAAVLAWRTWREARHAASPGSGTEDPLYVMLRDWWQAEALPPVSELGEADAQRILIRIAELEWDTRPYDSASGLA